MHDPHVHKRAQRSLRNVATLIGRIEREGWGRNAVATERGILNHFERIEHAIDAGLLSNAELDRCDELERRLGGLVGFHLTDDH